MGRHKGYTFIDKWTRSKPGTRADVDLMAEIYPCIQSSCLVRLLQQLASPFPFLISPKDNIIIYKTTTRLHKLTLSQTLAQVLIKLLPLSGLGEWELLIDLFLVLGMLHLVSVQIFCIYDWLDLAIPSITLHCKILFQSRLAMLLLLKLYPIGHS